MQLAKLRRFDEVSSEADILAALKPMGRIADKEAKRAAIKDSHAAGAASQDVEMHGNQMLGDDDEDDGFPPILGAIEDRSLNLDSEMEGVPIETVP